MKIVTLDIETSLTFAEARAESQDGVLRFENHPWIAVTLLNGKLERWYSENATGLMGYLLECDIINGWNISNFDLPIIFSTHSKTFFSVPNEAESKIQDIFQIAAQATKTPGRKHGMAYKLEEVAQANGLGGKLLDSSRIPEIFRSGDLETVFAHCERDVMLEQEIGILACAGSLILPEKTDKHGAVPQSVLTMPKF